MAYPYICDACLKWDCKRCEENRDIPPDGAIGGGFCICSHEIDAQTPLEKQTRRIIEQLGLT